MSSGLVLTPLLPLIDRRTASDDAGGQGAKSLYGKNTPNEHLFAVTIA